MDEKIKSEIALIQIQYLKAIKSHQICYEKLRDGDDKNGVKGELESIQKVFKECQERQNLLLQKFKSKIGNTIYKFKLYEVPLCNNNQGKKRRRKDLCLPVKSEKKNPPPAVITSSRSPSPTKIDVTSTDTSESSDSEDEFELSQSTLPVPLPQARPKLLQYSKDFSISRHGLSTNLVRRRRTAQKISDEDLCREIPIIEDPPPSPEPVDEKQAKIKFMAALNLIPTETVQDVLNRKTERKRRSTAHPHFVYNDDWDVPQIKKRPRQYLSPVKLKPLANGNKVKTEKVKNEDNTDEVGDDKMVRQVNVTDVSNEDQSDQADEKTICKTCGLSDEMWKCQDCDEFFHPKCPSVALVDQSFLRCCRCRRAVKGSEESDLAEPRPKDDSPLDAKDLMQIRETLVKSLCQRMEEKQMLEEKSMSLAESLSVQNKLKKSLLSESKELISKIEFIKRFVMLYQKVSQVEKKHEQEAKVSEEITNGNNGCVEIGASDPPSTNEIISPETSASDLKKGNAADSVSEERSTSET